MLESGIYKLRNTLTNDFYVGQAVDLRQRFWEHLCDLRKGRHPNRHLQNAWNKYGPEAFEFLAIIRCPPEYLTVAEQWALDVLSPVYNINQLASSVRGIKWTEQSRDKMRGNKNSLGATRPKVVRDKISASLMGHRYYPRREVQ